LGLESGITIAELAQFEGDATGSRERKSAREMVKVAAYFLL
jgi:hypothetical protein